MNTLSVADIFHSSWDTLSPIKRAIIGRQSQYARMCLDQELYEQAGYHIRILLRQLCRDKRAMRQILRMPNAPEVIVDIYHDLRFLHEPYYAFPIREVGEYLPPQYAEGKVPFGEVTFYRWKFIDSKFTKYLCMAHMKDPQARVELGKFIATLYKPADKAWHESMLDDGHRLLGKLALWEIDLILETYGHIRTYIVNRYPHVFPKTGEESPADNSPTYTGHMWESMHYDIADTEAFKGYIAAGDALMHHVLGYLNKRIEEAERQQRKANAHVPA